MQNVSWQRRLMLAIATFVTVVLLGQWQPVAAIQTPTPSPGETLNWAEVESSTLTLAPQQFTATEGSFCPSDLRQAIASIANQPQFDSARWGIVIEAAADGTILYEQNADLALDSRLERQAVDDSGSSRDYPQPQSPSLRGP
jgi:D-alanyl-D-alanine carboxypeptidase